jgi:hypothetical protein
VAAKEGAAEDVAAREAGAAEVVPPVAWASVVAVLALQIFIADPPLH